MIRKDGSAGDAWLSSVRSVRSALKWDNERNPCRLLQVSDETAPSLFFIIFMMRSEGEEGGADVKSARPLCPGLHTCYNEL